ncbi:MAG: flagellar biosynthesis anti-sigma factor FlgM [Methylococcaceae bacterium]|nr:flagellar biosynthesis anti-sigma factor FlgM [Methylococcaceae bacterium]
MTIQSLGKANNIALPSKTTLSNKVENSSPQSPLKSTDNVDITVAAKQISESSGSSSMINQDRIDEIKKSLDEGVYQVDANRIADKMIQMEIE